VTPNLATYSMSASVSYINTTLALNLSAEQIVSYLKKMMIHPVKCAADGKSLEASIPVTRAGSFIARLFLLGREQQL